MMAVTIGLFCKMYADFRFHLHTKRKYGERNMEVSKDRFQK